MEVLEPNQVVFIERWNQVVIVLYMCVVDMIEEPLERGTTRTTVYTTAQSQSGL